MLLVINVHEFSIMVYGMKIRFHLAAKLIVQIKMFQVIYIRPSCIYIIMIINRQSTNNLGNFRPLNIIFNVSDI